MNNPGVTRPKDYYATVEQFGPDAWDPEPEPGHLRPDVLERVRREQACEQHRAALRQVQQENEKGHNGNNAG